MLKPEEWFQKSSHLQQTQVEGETTLLRQLVHICILQFIQSSSDYFISSSLF